MQVIFKYFINKYDKYIKYAPRRRAVFVHFANRRPGDDRKNKKKENFSCD